MLYWINEMNGHILYNRRYYVAYMPHNSFIDDQAVEFQNSG